MSDAPRPFFVPDLAEGKEFGPLRALNCYNFEAIRPFVYINTSEPIAGLLFAPPAHNFLRLRRPTPSNFEVFYANPAKKWALRTLQHRTEDAVLFEFAGQLTPIGHIDQEEEEDDDYIFAFEYQNRHFQLDAFRRGNLARFVNHSCEPNCHTRLALVEDGGGSTDGQCDAVPHLFICASRPIVAGEEITLEYGDKWWHAKRTTVAAMRCQCNTKSCRFKCPA